MNKRFFLLVSSALALIAFVSCTEKSPVVGNLVGSDDVIAIPVTGTALAYTGYANDGSVIVRGFLMIFVSDPGTVRGRWQLRAIGDTLRIGPQHGEGTLVGALHDGLLNINLNPSNVDNNVLLSGRFDRERYVGRWSWVGFAGVLNSGTFEAVRGRHPAETNAY